MSSELERLARLGWRPEMLGPFLDGVRFVGERIEVDYPAGGLRALGLDGGEGYWFDPRAHEVVHALTTVTRVRTVWDVGAGTGSMSTRCRTRRRRRRAARGRRQSDCTPRMQPGLLRFARTAATFERLTPRDRLVRRPRAHAESSNFDDGGPSRARAGWRPRCYCPRAAGVVGRRRGGWSSSQVPPKAARRVHGLVWLRCRDVSMSRYL